MSREGSRRNSYGVTPDGREGTNPVLSPDWVTSSDINIGTNTFHAGTPELEPGLLSVVGYVCIVPDLALLDPEPCCSRISCQSHDGCDMMGGRNRRHTAQVCTEPDGLLDLNTLQPALAIDAATTLEEAGAGPLGSNTTL